MENQTTQKKGFGGWLEKTFSITERNSTVKTEIIAGLTTFFAMCYIVIVNPNSIAGSAEANPEIWNSVYVGGTIAAVIGTLLMAFVAKRPFAQAAGMGLNSFFFVSFILPAMNSNGALDAKDAYGAGLVIILISGIIFMLLSVTGLRKLIATALPDCLKKAISAGIGLFIAFLGAKSAGLVQDNMYTFVQITDFTKIVDQASWASIGAPVISAFLGLILIAVFAKSKLGFLRKGSIILGIVITSVLYYLMTWTLPSFDMSNTGKMFSDFAAIGFSAFKPESWKLAFDGATLGSVFSVLMTMVGFLLVDMFDTIGTLYGTCSQAGMLNENGDPDRLDQCLLCDSIGTVAGAMLGTSTITTFVESASGVAEGGRTGFASVITALGLLLCLFLSPLAMLIPSVATAPALMYVGVLMLRNFASVDMSDIRFAVPSFLTMFFMPMTYSISNGIGVGAIAYVLITLLTGKYTRKDIVVTVIAILFALRFAFISM